MNPFVLSEIGTELGSESLSQLEELSKGEQLLPDEVLNEPLDEGLSNMPNSIENNKSNEGVPSLEELSNDEDILSARELNKSFSEASSEASETIPDSMSELNEGMGKANKEAGCRREGEVEQELDKKYPESKGYDVISEAYLRNENGEIVQDPISGERRRIDFVVVKDNSVIDSIEVTSETADKTQQMAKEGRIREAGGNFIRTYDGSLAKLPDDLTTHIERRA